MIVTEGRSGLALLTIERHEKRNALDIDHIEQLEAAVTTTAGSGARTIVITGAGSSFCSGADLDGAYSEAFRVALYRMLHAVSSVPIPVIAAVNGPAIGAGTQLAIACDLRIAAPRAVFAVSTARNGLAVDAWTIRRLALLSGGGTARALLLACDTFDADRALTRGLADRLGSLDDALALAREICEFAPLSLSHSKKALDSLFETERWSEHLDSSFEQCWASEDLAEGKKARAERRRPRFIGK